mmetsp:Transcript_23791/g.68673  ORF Transcript_23791/g.68673 Transcript_23791/m.68673 type:complete len:332 (-) Transcript_23791:78-1073(-)
MWADGLASLREGLAEFGGQLRKDGRALAEEKGVDLATLDAIEETLATKQEELSSAVDALTRDETLAQLLELQRGPEPAEEVPQAAPATEGREPREPALEPALDRDRAPPRAARSPAPDPKAQIAALEARCMELAVVSENALSQAAALEARCTELSVVSDDALSQAEALRREGSSLQHQAQEEQAKSEALEREVERLRRLLGEAAEHQPPDAEGGRLQELEGEVAYLRKALEVKEQKLQESLKDRACLQQRDLAEKAAARDPERGLLDAHTAIAAAFGDALSGPPIVRFFDEPLLRFTALLFKQPFFRRAFFASSAMTWLFVLHHIVAAKHS